MKKAFSLLCLLFSCVLFYISCKKELSCENCKSINQPPIANAGRDTIIILPIDSTLLDGSASRDPDGTITSYKWAKIVGHVSTNVVRPDSSITILQILVAGVYQFELTVTDNGGLSAKDTMQVIVAVNTPVNKPPVANAGSDQEIIFPINSVTLDGSSSTDPENNILQYNWTKINGNTANIANANAKQTQVTGLEPGLYLFELKVTDSGGLLSKDIIEVEVIACDNSNRPRINIEFIEVGTHQNIEYEMGFASVGNNIVFATGNSYPFLEARLSKVDIYDFATQTWSNVGQLSETRSSFATVAAGNKIFFAGGSTGDGAPNQLFSVVDIYDVSTKSWSKASLSEPRSHISAATVGNKVFFAGGVNDGWNNMSSDRVDVYDLFSNSWSTMQLSEPRHHISAVTVSNKIYFAGGRSENAGTSNRIDIYDDAIGSWSTSSLKEGRFSLSGIAHANKIFWAGGQKKVGDGGTCLVEVKELNSGNSSVDYLSRPGVGKAVAWNNKLIFYGSRFDIYDVTTNTWSIGVFPINVKGGSIFLLNNSLYLVGGSVNGVVSNKIWKVEF